MRVEKSVRDAPGLYPVPHHPLPPTFDPNRPKMTQSDPMLRESAEGCNPTLLQHFCWKQKLKCHSTETVTERSNFCFTHFLLLIWLKTRSQ